MEREREMDRFVWLGYPEFVYKRWTGLRCEKFWWTSTVKAEVEQVISPIQKTSSYRLL